MLEEEDPGGEGFGDPFVLAFEEGGPGRVVGDERDGSVVRRELTDRRRADLLLGGLGHLGAQARQR